MKNSRIRFLALFLLFMTSIAVGLISIVNRRGNVNRVLAIRPFDITNTSQEEIASQTGKTSKTLVVNQADHKTSKLLHFNLTRYGAWAEVNCRVTDRFGNPVPNADVHLYFDTPEL